VSVEPLIITAAVVGAELSRADTPYLPLTPSEIAAEACAAADAGASIVHLHARADGLPTQDAGVYQQIITDIRTRCPDLIIQVSTGGAIGMTAEERLQPVYLRPDMASLTTGSVNFGEAVFLNELPLVRRFAQVLREQSVRPEIEVFDSGMITTALRLLKEGLLIEPLHFGLVMGVPGGVAATPKNLLHLVESLPPGSTWSVAGVGAAQLPMATMAILMGGHVRVGLEDNIYYTRGVLSEGNAPLVSRIVRLAQELGRPVARPAEARRILCLRTC